MVNRRDMPTWLAMHQAVAWVVYRDVQAVDQASTRNGLFALNLWEGTKGSDASIEFGAFALPQELKQSRWMELHRALEDGSLKAEGLDSSGHWSVISSVAWTQLPITPLDTRRWFPYRDIRVASRAVLNKWPLEPGAKSPFKKTEAKAIFDRLSADQPNLSQKRMAKELRVAYQVELGRTHVPSEETCVHWVRRWREELGRTPSEP